ncbi:MAG: nicotinate phosphoribosyltransferase [Bacillota bacterium]
MSERNLSLLMDFYELTMANGYFKDNKHNQIAVFDVFFRSIPDDGGYAVFAGLEQVIHYIQNLKFEDDVINYLRTKEIFDENFLLYLQSFTFHCDVYAMKEGTPIFPHEPILVVKGPILECQLIETMVLLTINHQSLIATKAARIVYAAQGRGILEFGARRAHGYDASIFGARAAYISGVVGSSNTYVDFAYHIPAMGTMAHSFVQSYDSEYEAFRAYALTYPKNAVLLVDTYNTLKQGLPNAIKIQKEVLDPMGCKLKGIRLDSGDLTYLTKESRKMLDAAGMTYTKITVSNSLDEYLIKELIHQGAQIDSFGVGERLVTARSEAVFGGVFKLSAIEVDGKLVSKIKISDNIQKTTIPGFKQVYRFFDEKHMAEADVMTLFDEKIDSSKPYYLFDPNFPWKSKLIENYTVTPLLIPIFEKGKLIYELPSLLEIRDYAKQQHQKLWPEVLRLEKPHEYYVDLSQELWELKQSLIKQYRSKN